MANMAGDLLSVHAMVPSPVTFNPTDIMELVGDEPTIAGEVVEMFLGDYPDRLADILAAVREHDPVRLRLAAHALKGAAANLTATTVVTLTTTLEEYGRNANMDNAPAVASDLCERLAALADDLTEWRRQLLGVDLTRLL
jgi:HPt (histidine-containing phosphotransfer) domain-containing protein